MMILSIFNNFSKKYFFADKNVHTASNGIRWKEALLRSRDKLTGVVAGLKFRLRLR